MQTKSEDLDSILVDSSNLLQFITAMGNDEDQILAKIEAFINKYDKETFLTQASKFHFAAQFADNSEESKVTYHLLHHVVVQRYNKIVAFLINIDINTNVLTASENKHFDKLPAWKLGVLIDNLTSPLLFSDCDLLKYFYLMGSAKEQILPLIYAGFTSYSNSINLFKETELIDHLLDLAKEKDLIHELLSTKNPKGTTFIEPFALQTTPYSLKKLMQLKNWFKYTDLKSVLEKARLSSWKYPDHYEGFNELCLEIRNLPQYKDQINKAITLKPHGHSVSMEDAYFNLFKNAYKPNTGKSEALKCMMAQATALLNSPEKCLKYLQFLDKELIRYYSETYSTSFPQINPNDYEIEIIDGLFFPIPKEDYKGCHKNNALDKLLIAKFKEYDLAELSYQWIGFIPRPVSLKMLKQSYFVKENKYGSGVFHGTLAHMLQQVILIYAIEHGEIDLSYVIDTEKNNLCVKEFLAAFLEIKQADSKLVWANSRDYRFFLEISFSDPFRLTSVIMHQGREFELSALSASLIDSFCKNFNKVLTGYKETLPSINFDKQTWIEQLNDLRIHIFQIPDLLCDYAIKQAMPKLQADQELLPLLIQGEKSKFAAIPRKYTQDNPGFEPLQYNKNTSLFFTQKASQKSDEVVEPMLSIVDLTL